MYSAHDVNLISMSGVNIGLLLLPFCNGMNLVKLFPKPVGRIETHLSQRQDFSSNSFCSSQSEMTCGKSLRTLFTALSNSA